MRTLKHLTFCLAAAFIATGCSQEDNEPQTTVKKGTPAEFTMTINGGTGTRTITTHNEENRTISWREGDEVGIFAVSSDGTQSNRKYTYNNNEWKAVSVSDAITLTEGTDYTFYAYYPYTANITAAAASLNVLPDQSTQGEGNSSYDFIFRYQKNRCSYEMLHRLFDFIMVVFTFYHRLFQIGVFPEADFA